ncbi:thymidine kinase [Candidatus Saccharibacteria bacterium]|nr:MAG: thymidine kinase [Candidatus Saccharibacteria bacterium]
MSKLHFKYGAMNSGKSDMLIKTAYNYQEQGLKVLVVKPAIDTKGGQKITARAGGSWRVDILADESTDLAAEISERSKKQKLNCVLVDEAQFLTAQQIDQLFLIAKQQNISVICYGLRADFLTNTFTGSQRLFEIADNIEKIPTMCKCGSQAEFNCRKVNDKFVFSGSQVAIDGEGEITYDSLCGLCRLKAIDEARR